jgi:hypothetical protein
MAHQCVLQGYCMCLADFNGFWGHMAAWICEQPRASFARDLHALQSMLASALTLPSEPTQAHVWHPAPPPPPPLPNQRDRICHTCGGRLRV